MGPIFELNNGEEEKKNGQGSEVDHIPCIEDSPGNTFKTGLHAQALQGKDGIPVGE